MKIISWNCNGAFRKKLKEVDALNGDVLIIQECENPAESTKEFRDWAGDYLWVGKSKNKGLGVFPKNGNKVKALSWNGSYKINGIRNGSSATKWKTEDLELFLPFSINDEFTVLGVWTKGKDSVEFSYIGQLWKYIQIHLKDLQKKKTMIVGDLNRNSIWDKNDRWWNHSDVVSELEEIGIKSVYHYQENEKHGSETFPTFYFRKNVEKTYHIDYAFCSEDILGQSNLEIGIKEDWLKISDHVPLILEI